MIIASIVITPYDVVALSEKLGCQATPEQDAEPQQPRRGG